MSKYTGIWRTYIYKSGLVRGSFVLSPTMFSLGDRQTPEKKIPIFREQQKQT